MRFIHQPLASSGTLRAISWIQIRTKSAAGSPPTKYDSLGSSTNTTLT
jgi:hypothetical protein